MVIPSIGVIYSDATKLSGDTTEVGSQITTSGPYNESLETI